MMTQREQITVTGGGFSEGFSEGFDAGAQRSGWHDPPASFFDVPEDTPPATFIGLPIGFGGN